MNQVAPCSEITTSLESDVPELTRAIKIIESAKQHAHERLILSSLKLFTVPREILELRHLKKVVLSQNRLIELPNDFFSVLTHLSWLDLRSNLLTQIPASIRKMVHLEVLLIDDNRIAVLPFEMGLLRKLRALHTRNNPIDFPPSMILESGLENILRFLKACYISRTQANTQKGRKMYQKVLAGRVNPVLDSNNSWDSNGHLVHEPPDSDESVVGSSEKSPICLTEQLVKVDTDVNHTERNSDSGIGSCTPEAEFANEPSTSDSHEKLKRPSTVLNSIATMNYIPDAVDIFDLSNELTNKLTCVGSGENHSSKSLSTSQPPSWIKSKAYKKIERLHLQNKTDVRKLSGAFTKFVKQSARHDALLPEIPPQPSMRRIRSIHSREQRMKSRKAELILQEKRLQKLRDEESVRRWRDEYRKKRDEKLLEYLGKTGDYIKDEANWRIKSAPFDVNREDLKMLGAAELHAAKQRQIRVSPKPCCLDANTVLKLELISAKRDRLLTQEVNRLVEEVTRRYQQPLPTNQGALHKEMLSAKHDLDLAIRLYAQVKYRLETLEHFHGSNSRDAQW
ncbi:unnamed protein product [Dicrocoelium dendriticum]|nr:unnamed protein product [Dicrocoelium dendriticum]